MGVWKNWQERRRVIQVYREAGALIPERSRKAGDLGLETGAALLGLIRRGVLVEGVRRQGYYLDEGLLMRQRMNAGKWAMSVLMLALILLGLLLFGRP